MKLKEVRYIKRTVKHIHRVQNNMVYLITRFSKELQLSEKEIKQLLNNVMVHDLSKFSNRQYDQYIELTEYYRQRKVLGNKDYDYIDDHVKYLVDCAVIDHYNSENHHPERLKDDELFEFGKLETIECICDLQAMAQEFNEGSCRKYFTEVWIKKQSENFRNEYEWNNVLMLALDCIDFFEYGIEEEES